MSDSERRRLERLSEQGDAAARVQLLRLRAREGTLLPWRLELAAYAGDEVAFEALSPQRREALIEHEWRQFRPASADIWATLEREDPDAAIRAASSALCRAVEFCAVAPVIAANLPEILKRFEHVPSPGDVRFLQRVVEEARFATLPLRVHEDLASVAASAEALLGALEGKKTARAAFEAAMRPSGQPLDSAITALVPIPKRAELAAYVGAAGARSTSRPRLAFQHWSGGIERWGKAVALRAVLACYRADGRGEDLGSVVAWLAEPSRALAEPIRDPSSGAVLELSQHELGLPDWSSVGVARAFFATISESRREACSAAVAAFALSEEPLFRFSGLDVLEELPHRPPRGDAYRASDPSLGNDLFLLALDGRLQEAEARKILDPIAALEHPGLARLLRVGFRGEGNLRCVFLVYARASGLPLERWLEGERKLDERRELIRGLLAALEHAHGRRVVHGSLGASSVVVDGGTPRVVDHGHGVLRELADRDPNETRMLEVDAAYSPELVMGGTSRTDARSDVYGAGALAAWILGGRPIFEGSPGEIARRILQEEPGPLGYRDSVLRRALSKDPAKRFPTLAAFRAALLDE